MNYKNKSRKLAKTIFRYYLTPFKDIFKTEKLVSRKDFFLYLPGIILNSLVYYWLLYQLQPFNGEYINSINSSLLLILRVFTYSLGFLQFYTLSLRRLEDAGKSFFWWYAIFLPRAGIFDLIKILVGLYIFYLLCLPSKNENKITNRIEEDNEREIYKINGKEYIDDENHTCPVTIKKSDAKKYPQYDWMEDKENPELVWDSFFEIIPWKNGEETRDYDTYEQDFCSYYDLDPKDIVNIGPGAG
tara:strand:+ start:599 stop:1330 length:732 start_codon:yes stop_codon:yes gene_type:complete